MTANTLDIEQVTEFATAVRRALSDLGPDILDDLTDGLEADLADKLADGEPLGDPAAYAAELRAAAGVSPERRPSALDRARADIAAFREGLQPLLRTPFVAGVLGFLITLRPVWWVLRAWGIFLIVSGAAYPRNEFGTFVLIALVIVSVQWGRGKWLPWKWMRGALVFLSVVSVLALPFAVGSLSTPLWAWDNYAGDEVYTPEGLVLNGSVVTNVFAYGADGKPLDDVRLYDQDGSPLSILPANWGPAGSYWLDDDTILVPSQAAGTEGWNVYPLQSVKSSDLTEDGNVPSWAKRIQPTPPLYSVQPLLGYEAPEADTDEK